MKKYMAKETDEKAIKHQLIVKIKTQFVCITVEKLLHKQLDLDKQLVFMITGLFVSKNAWKGAQKVSLWLRKSRPCLLEAV